MQDEITVIEFYSGVGGMHFALEASGIKYKILTAFDINTNANQVYCHNFSEINISQKNLEGLTCESLEKYNASCWTMSPPCQPYTRQGKQECSKDPRARSFLHIMELLQVMKSPPSYILLENVKGFELSDSCQLFTGILHQLGYATKEFLLTPSDFGIPNSRLRYYLLAKLNTKKTWLDTPSSTPVEWKDIPEDLSSKMSITKDFLIKNYITNGNDGRSDHQYINKDVLLRFYRIMDIVFPESNHSCCFTKAYSKYIEGTGSILANVSENEGNDLLLELEKANNEEGKLTVLTKLKLRFFTPMEIMLFNRNYYRLVKPERLLLDFFLQRVCLHATPTPHIFKYSLHPNNFKRIAHGSGDQFGVKLKEKTSPFVFQLPEIPNEESEESENTVLTHRRSRYEEVVRNGVNLLFASPQVSEELRKCNIEITRVKLSTTLRAAQVFWKLNEHVEHILTEEDVSAILNKRLTELRLAFPTFVRISKVPAISFKCDRSEDKENELSSLIDTLKEKERL